MTTRDLVIVSVAAALSTSLSFLRLYEMPQGGSVTLDPLPIFYVALLRGPVAGLSAGALSGVIQLLLRPFIVHPVQVLLDYPLAMAACGLAGLFRWKGAAGAVRIFAGTLAGVVVGGGIKLGLHVVSGVVFFSAYAPEGQSVLLYSVIYNASYAVPQIVLSAIILPLLLKRTRTD